MSKHGRKPSSPFTARPGRYANVPKRVKSPKTKSGCAMEVFAVAATLVAAIFFLCA